MSDDAKNAAWRAALAIAQHRRTVAAEAMRAAEIQVLRTALAATLPGGEVEYWERVDRALRWLAWLRKSFPETTFIAPWIATVMSLDGDDSPGLREAGLVDDCAVVERCDGIVLCGGRISSGMRREMEHGKAQWEIAQHDIPPSRFDIYDLTGHADPPLTVGPVDMTLAAAEHIMRRGG